MNQKKSELLLELETITDVLVADHRELAQFLIAEKQTKLNVYADALDARTNADRLHIADFAALDLTTDVFKLKAKIAGHEARIAYITTALKYQE